MVICSAFIEAVVRTQSTYPRAVDHTHYLCAVTRSENLLVWRFELTSARLCRLGLSEGSKHFMFSKAKLSFDGFYRAAWLASSPCICLVVSYAKWMERDTFLITGMLYA